MESSPADLPVFLRKKLPFYLTLAVILTTLFSWFNVNSLCIMALLLLRLLDGGPKKTIRAAFSNKYFLSWLSLFLIEAIALAYSHHPGNGWKYVERKATLAALPFVLCAGPFTDIEGRRRLMAAYCGLLSLASLCCLATATWHYSRDHDSTVFFYHLLSRPLDQNAIFFSGYIICAILFLLFTPLSPGPAPFQGKPWSMLAANRPLRAALVLFFSGMIILLSSKLILILLIIVLFVFAARIYHIRAHPFALTGFLALILLTIALIAGTKNPIKRRYQDIIMQGDFSLAARKKLPPGTDFNGISLRLVIWRFAWEILNEQHAWIAGVSAGDSQYLLDQKYIAAEMWTGIPGTENKGFLDYNFHNEYVEVGVRTGLIGLSLLLLNCGLMIGLARKKASAEAAFTVAMILILYLTESMLEMQHAMFLSCFFPLLLLYLPAPEPTALRPAV